MISGIRRAIVTGTDVKKEITLISWIMKLNLQKWKFY